MIVECGHCGAPLDVREGSRYTRCTYCKKTSEQRALRTIQPQTPPHWRPPPVWTPPLHVPANSAVPLRYAAGAGAASVVIAVFAFVLVALGGAVAFGVAARSKRPITGAPGSESRLAPSALAKITLTESAEKLRKITGVAMDSNYSMRVPLSHPNWQAVTFRWDKDHLDHVKDFFFNGESGSPSPDARKKLKSLLERRWGKDGFQWEGCGLYVSEKSDHVGGNVTIVRPGTDGENPRWKQQVEAMWQLARYGVLGVGDKPNKQLLRDNLGLGYSFADLAKLDTEADIDQAEQAVTAVFPGAVRRLMINLEYKIALDHPTLGDVELAWKNKKGAKLAELEVRPPIGADNKWPKQNLLDDCVTAAFGKPSRVSNGDHLGGSRDTTWTPAAGGSIRVYHHMIMVTLRDSPFSKPMPKDVWLKTIAALDTCGR